MLSGSTPGWVCGGSRFRSSHYTHASLRAGVFTLKREPQSATLAVCNGCTEGRSKAGSVSGGKNLIDVKSSLYSKGTDRRPIYGTQDPTAAQRMTLLTIREDPHKDQMQAMTQLRVVSRGSV